MELISAITTLFLVMDPLGNVPLFLSVLKTVAPQRRRAVLVREILFAYVVLILFVVAGRHLLQFLGLQPEAVGIAGGIVLFLIALRMIFPHHGSVAGDAPYHVAMVQTFEDEPGSEPQDDSPVRLRQLFTGYYALLRQLNDVEPEDPSLPDEALALSFHVAAALDCDPGVKQRLLVERSTARRVQALLMLIPILTAGVESALRVHRRAHTNGRGGARPDVITET